MFAVADTAADQHEQQQDLRNWSSEMEFSHGSLLSFTSVSKYIWSFLSLWNYICLKNSNCFQGAPAQSFKVLCSSTFCCVLWNFVKFCCKLCEIVLSFLKLCSVLRNVVTVKCVKSNFIVLWNVVFFEKFWKFLKFLCCSVLWNFYVFYVVFLWNLLVFLNMLSCFVNFCDLCISFVFCEILLCFVKCVFQKPYFVLNLGDTMTQ